MMNISDTPFPHIIIDDYFTDEELELILREFNFLLPKFGDPSTFGGAENDDGTYMSDSTGLSLDGVYNNRDISDILTISSKRLFDLAFWQSISKDHEFWEQVVRSDLDYTKIRRYAPGEDYLSHQDCWVNALVSWTLQEDTGGGGDLYFEQHDLYIKSKTNRCVIFPGWVKHMVTPVVETDRFALTKFLHCVSKTTGTGD